jgi:phospholipid/cholesterol/gamma-HCH transport system substrate-binding protein
MHRPPAPPRPPAVIDGGGQPNAHPSSFGGNATQAVPPVAVATYDPRNGRYVTPDGKFYEQSDLSGAAPKKWQDMFPT